MKGMNLEEKILAFIITLQLILEGSNSHIFIIEENTMQQVLILCIFYKCFIVYVLGWISFIYFTILSFIKYLLHCLVVLFLSFKFFLGGENLVSFFFRNYNSKNRSTQCAEVIEWLSSSNRKVY